MPSMTNTGHGSQTNADNEEIILGVDTHKDTHAASVITVLGVHLSSVTFPTTTTAYRRLLKWARGLGACCSGPGSKAPAATARP
jgi:hypothetical protein